MSAASAQYGADHALTTKTPNFSWRSRPGRRSIEQRNTVTRDGGNPGLYFDWG